MSTRGGLELRWSRKNPPNTVERSLVLVGQTADAGRVRDVASLFANIRIKRDHDKAQYRTVGRGNAGVIAAYAALLVPGIEHELVHPRSPHLPPRRPALPERRSRDRLADRARPVGPGREADAHQREGQGIRQDGGDLQAGWCGRQVCAEIGVLNRRSRIG